MAFESIVTNLFMAFDLHLFSNPELADLLNFHKYHNFFWQNEIFIEKVVNPNNLFNHTPPHHLTGLLSAWTHIRAFKNPILILEVFQVQDWILSGSEKRDWSFWILDSQQTSSNATLKKFQEIENFVADENTSSGFPIGDNLQTFFSVPQDKITSDGWVSLFV